MQSVIICITNEFHTSKTCSLCLQQVTLARSHHLVDGKLKTVCVNSVVECHNQVCPSVQKGYCIKSRDGNAALNISLAGISTLMHPSRKTLFQFSQWLTTQPYLSTAPASLALVLPSPSGLAATKYFSTQLDETFPDISAHLEQVPSLMNQVLRMWLEFLPVWLEAWVCLSSTYYALWDCIYAGLSITDIEHFSFFPKLTRPNVYYIDAYGHVLVSMTSRLPMALYKSICNISSFRKKSWHSCDIRFIASVTCWG